jgi:hypothetical protein
MSLVWIVLRETAKMPMISDVAPTRITFDALPIEEASQLARD